MAPKQDKFNGLIQFRLKDLPNPVYYSLANIDLQLQQDPPAVLLYDPDSSTLLGEYVSSFPLSLPELLYYFGHLTKEDLDSYDDTPIDTPISTPTETPTQILESVEREVEK